ncbi:penicillin acylase family protein [Qipengyuania sp. MTN3-11]|uniref:penicillin acylase family protein n=1 Tax=Qipengyuania sp. MTN3-11 TaxID=3056557 RepID=UPI0036F2C94B
MRRIALLPMLAIALAGCATTAPDTGPLAAASASQCCAEREARIDWDEWGVPHIRAGSDVALRHAYGWAQARGRPDQLLELIGTARGRGAEYWGEDRLAEAQMLWTMGVPQSAERLHAAQSPEYRAQIDAFADGINAWFAAHPDSGSAAMRQVLPVSGPDIMAHIQRVVNLSFNGGRELAQAQRLIAGSASAPGEAGSNGWAIAPSRSASGHAMLLMNPHLPWDGIFTWFEGHHVSPGQNAYGVSLIGQPFPSIMFNEQLGWTHTVNVFDGADIFLFDLAEGGYRIGEEVLPFATETVSLKVRGADGAMTTRDLPIRRTAHGPVVGMAGGKAVVVKIAGLGDAAHARTFDQYAAMAEADSRAEFEAALAQMQMPMFNVIYADRAGEILYLSNGLTPVRDKGDAAFWAAPVDGSNPENLWTEYRPYSDLIRVANPPSGFVQNANEPGYTATLPLVTGPQDYPQDYPVPALPGRPQHSLELLLADQSITFDELIAYAHDTRFAVADNLLDDLIAAARGSGDATAGRAAEVLAGWNRRHDADSRGAALFALWAFAFLREGGSPYERDWSFADPTAFPSGIDDAKEPAAVAALVGAAQMLEKAGAPLDLPWGAIARTPDGKGGTLPSNLGIGEFGAFRPAYFAPKPDGTGLQFLGGTGWVAAIEFADTPKARAILPYGNFAVPPEWVRDQHGLYATGQLREVNYSDESLAGKIRESETIALPAE